MRALSLWQPWASLVAVGEKRVETRGWRPPPSVVGWPIAIHATQRVEPGGMRAYRERLASEPFAAVLARHDLDERSLPRGAIVGIVTVVEASQCSGEWPGWFPDWRAEFEEDFGDYSPGRWAWRLAGAVAVEPVPCLGHQRVWTLAPVVKARLREAWARRVATM